MGASIATRIAPLAARAGTGLYVFLGAVAFDLPVTDLSAPRAGRSSSLLNELLEAPQIALDAHVIRPQDVADPLGDVFGLPVHLELDLRLALAEGSEAHDALVASARRAPPRDDLVGHLLIDLGVPLLDLARDLRPPVQALVVELLDRFDTFHESRELLELGPLVIGEPDRNVRFD